MRSSFRIAAQMIRTSIQAQAQYRVDFLLQLFLAFFWTLASIAPLWLVFEIRPDIGGWSRPEAMLVMSAFLVLKALIDGIISPNLNALVEQVRLGTFDFVLLKPADPQLLVSASRVVVPKLADLAAGLGLSAWSILQIDPAPSVLQIAAGGIMLLAGALGIYGVWMLIICTAFWFVKIDNLSFLFTSIFDAARWPISVFRGWLGFILTFVLPIAVMTSFPALAVLGRLSLARAAFAGATTAFLLFFSRRVWLWALRHYASASS